MVETCNNPPPKQPLLNSVGSLDYTLRTIAEDIHKVAVTGRTGTPPNSQHTPLTIRTCNTKFSNHTGVHWFTIAYEAPRPLARLVVTRGAKPKLLFSYRQKPLHVIRAHTRDGPPGAWSPTGIHDPAWGPQRGALTCALFGKVVLSTQRKPPSRPSRPQPK